MVWNFRHDFQNCTGQKSYLDAVSSTFHPWNWSGNLSDVLKSRRELVAQLDENTEPVIREWVKQLCDELDSEIEREIQRERENQEDRDERYE